MQKRGAYGTRTADLSVTSQTLRPLRHGGVADVHGQKPVYKFTAFSKLARQ